MKKKNPKNKNRFKEYYFFLPVVFLFAVFISVFIANFYFKNQINSILHNSLNISFKNPIFPIVFVRQYPDISAGGAIVMDQDSKQIVYSKNENVRFSPASTTKIMTALIALEYFKENDILTITDNQTDSVVGLTLGDRFMFKDLLYAMMLPSDNRAAASIAENYPGGAKAFVEKMNERASAWKLTQTHFGDPVGLLDDQDFSSPKDLAFLASIALKNKQLSEIASTKNIIISNLEKTRSFDLTNINILLGTDGIIGLKTGHTEQAGDVLVTAQQIQVDNQIHKLIIVVMKSDNRFIDTEKILGFLSNNITYLSTHL